jgi:hypothetical protein
MLIPISWASTELLSPNEAWPLKGSDIPDWIRMGRAKNSIWEICTPHLQPSLFADFFAWTNSIERSLEWTPPALLDLCSLSEGLDKTNIPPILNFEDKIQGNTYADAIMMIFRPPNEGDPLIERTNIYAISMALQKSFGQLVAAKDVPALVIMAYWYTQAAEGPWWLARRAILEGQATVMYLEEHAADDERVQGLLDEPRRVLFKNTDNASAGSSSGSASF